MVAPLKFAALLVSTADDCKQKSLKKLAIADDDTTSPYTPQSSINKRQSTNKQNIQKPDNLKVRVKNVLILGAGEQDDLLEGTSKPLARWASRRPVDCQLLKNIVLFSICCLTNWSFEQAL